MMDALCENDSRRIEDKPRQCEQRYSRTFCFVEKRSRFSDVRKIQQRVTTVLPSDTERSVLLTVSAAVQPTSKVYC
ncbi:hypothetical protein AVEN_250046-1, partial [Araneus ventricosus]